MTQRPQQDLQSSFRGVLRSGLGVLGVLGLAWLQSGCGPMPVAPASTGKDIVTTSDEDATRKRARIRLQLATAYYADGKLTTALDELKQAIAIDSGIAEAYNLRGLIYDALQDNELAEDSFKRALQLDPRDAGAMHNYGWFLCRQGKYAPAETLFAQAIETPQYRGLSQTYFVSGVCQIRQGKLSEAEARLKRAYELDAGNPAVATNLAYVLYRQGEYERARFYIRRVNDQPDYVNAETLWLGARIERKLGNPQGTKVLTDQLVGRFPRSPEARAFEGGRFED